MRLTWRLLVLILLYLTFASLALCTVWKFNWWRYCFALCDETFVHFSLFDETLRHIELWNSVISHIQRNLVKKDGERSKGNGSRVCLAGKMCSIFCRVSCFASVDLEEIVEFNKFCAPNTVYTTTFALASVPILLLCPHLTILCHDIVEVLLLCLHLLPLLPLVAHLGGQHRVQLVSIVVLPLYKHFISNSTFPNNLHIRFNFWLTGKKNQFSLYFMKHFF